MYGWLPEGKLGWGEDKEGKGGQTYGDETELWVVSKQCNVQTMYYRTVHSKLM